MKTLTIKWQRLVVDSQTCPRCDGTGREIRKAVRSLGDSLAPSGIRVILEELEMDQDIFAQDPMQSNRLWICDRPLEEWLRAQVGQSLCCGPCGDAACRTLEIDGLSLETIPAALIIKAGLQAASRLSKEQTRSSC